MDLILLYQSEQRAFVLSFKVHCFSKNFNVFVSKHYYADIIGGCSLEHGYLLGP